MGSGIVGVLRIDVERCEGHGRCYALAPQLFGSDDIGTGLVSRAELRVDDVSAAQRAVASCPEQAVVFEPTT